MLKLHLVQAEYGDCLILQYGTAAHARYLLIDGGPAGIYETHLRPELEKIAQSGGHLDALLLSHIDNDHVIGLLALLSEISTQRAAGKPDFISIDGIWLNAFSDADAAGMNAFTPFADQFSQNLAWSESFPSAAGEVFGINEGNKLAIAQVDLNIPLNPPFNHQLILADTAPRPVKMAGTKIWVLGPSRKNLQRLQKEWQKWLEKFEQAPFASALDAQKIDQSIPNLSSIMLLAEAGKRKILLTGDGLGDDLIEGLRMADRLDAHGNFHVSILKLPHHGSARNMNRKFFDVITADTYLISANGRYDNPDLATLIWLVESARAQGRKIRMIATNPTQATDDLLKNYPPDVFGYRLTILKPGVHSIRL